MRWKAATGSLALIAAALAAGQAMADDTLAKVHAAGKLFAAPQSPRTRAFLDLVL